MLDIGWVLRRRQGSASPSGQNWERRSEQDPFLLILCWEKGPLLSSRGVNNCGNSCSIWSHAKGQHLGGLVPGGTLACVPWPMS